MLFIYPPTPVSVSIPALAICVDGVDTPVCWDTTDPSLTIPVPNLLHYMENGQLEVVNYDGVDKTLTRAIPIKIVGADGTNVTIDITTGDINVQLTHTGSNPDSTQVGDGTTIWGIEPVTKKGLVKDSLVEIANQETRDRLPAAFGSQADAASVAVTQSTEDKLIQTEIRDRLPTSTGIQADAASLSVTQSTEDRAATVLRDIDIKSVNTKLPATLGSKLDAASLAVTSSTEDKQTQTDIKNRLPSTIGIQADAASLSVTQSTEDRAATVLRDIEIGKVAVSTDKIDTKLPATVGSKADADSLAVTQSTEDKATQNDIKSAIEAIAADSIDTTEDHYKRDFDTTPLTAASSWVVLRTLTAAIKRVSITNNSGNELLIRNQATAKTIIVGAGATVNTSLIGAIAEVIEISAIADTDGGIVYLNFEG